MNDLTANDKPTYYLKPGEIHFATEPARVITILGSCVSLVMYYRTRRLGAICHAMMPSMVDVRKEIDPARRFQYVDGCLEWMLARFAQYHIKPQSLEIKLFGGAGLFPDRRGGEQSLAVGERNIDMALRLIDLHGLRLKAWDVGGDKGRKLIFCTSTGEVLTKFVSRTKVPEQPFREDTR